MNRSQIAAACATLAMAVTTSLAEGEWKPWRSSISGGGTFGLSDTAFSDSTASGFFVDYELSLPHNFGLFVNYRAMDYESSGWDYIRTTRLRTEGELEGVTAGGRYYPYAGRHARVYVELGYGLWDLSEDNFRNGMFDEHDDFDANIVMLGGGVRVPLFDSPLELLFNVGWGYLWWDTEHYSDDDLYATFGVGVGLTF